MLSLARLVETGTTRSLHNRVTKAPNWEQISELMFY